MKLAPVKTRRRMIKLSSVGDLTKFLAKYPELISKHYAGQVTVHLQSSYRSAKGVQQLGVVPLRSVAFLVMPYQGRSATVELMIECEDGCISRDEAIGADFVPSKREIAEEARKIREKNDAAGLVRATEFRGFELRPVFSSTVYVQT